MELPSALQAVRQRLSAYSDGESRFVRLLLQANQHGLEALDKACTLSLAHGGCNDTVILDILNPTPKEFQDECQRLHLTSPPDDDCHGYNRSYLSKTAILGGTAYVL